MNVPKARKQHFVPCFYLRLFADNDEKFSVLDINKNHIIPNRVHYSSQCHKRYFYGEDEIWEKRLSKLEYKWACSIRKAICEDDLDEDDIISLKEFVLYQRQRTNSENNRVQKERESIIREWAKTLYKNEGWPFDDEAEQFCKKRAIEEVTPAENVELATRMVDYIKDLDVLIICYDTDDLLITSDSPVITINPFLRFQGFGYANIGIVFLLPLSPKHLLIVYDGTLYTKYNNVVYFKSAESQEVLNINKYEMINSEQLVFSSLLSNLDTSYDILKNRKREINRNKPQQLGPEGHKLVISSPKGIDYYYELPYFFLSRDYKRIPLVLREPILREYNKDFENKLNSKYKVFNQIKNISDEFPNISKTELKHGCRRMVNMAKIYWKNHESRFKENND